MLVSMRAKNAEGITFEEISFISKSRNNETSESVFKTKDGIYINKQLAIIGSNASGKTSTLKIISSVGEFIALPVYLNKILNDFKDDKESFDDLKKRIYQLSKLTPNVNAKEDSEIYLESYIESSNEETTGYYEYKIVFSNDVNENGVKSEELLFRSKYNSKKKITLSYKENIRNSQVGYLYSFLNNFEDQTENLKYINEFFRNVVRLVEIDNSNIGMNIYSIMDIFEKNKEIAVKTINLADSQIIDIIKIKENTKDNESDMTDYIFKTVGGKNIKYNQLSKGTRKILYIISKILHAISFEEIMLIDELDSAINNKLIDVIFETLYMKNNKSQIIFTTNYPDIIPENFKYDQIYMLKQIDGETNGIRLIDSTYNSGKKVRSDISFARAYREGRFNNEEENSKYKIRKDFYKEEIKNYLK